MYTTRHGGLHLFPTCLTRHTPNSGFRKVEQAIFGYIRQRLLRQKQEVGVAPDTFDTAQYLAGQQGRILAEIVEIPTPSEC